MPCPCQRLYGEMPCLSCDTSPNFMSRSVSLFGLLLGFLTMFLCDMTVEGYSRYRWGWNGFYGMLTESRTLSLYHGVDKNNKEEEQYVHQKVSYVSSSCTVIIAVKTEDMFLSFHIKSGELIFLLAWPVWLLKCQFRALWNSLHSTLERLDQSGELSRAVTIHLTCSEEGVQDGAAEGKIREKKIQKLKLPKTKQRYVFYCGNAKPSSDVPQTKHLIRSIVSSIPQRNVCAPMRAWCVVNCAQPADTTKDLTVSSTVPTTVIQKLNKQCQRGNVWHLPKVREYDRSLHTGKTSTLFELLCASEAHLMICK